MSKQEQKKEDWKEALKKIGEDLERKEVNEYEIEKSKKKGNSTNK